MRNNQRAAAAGYPAHYYCACYAFPAATSGEFKEFMLLAVSQTIRWRFDWISGKHFCFLHFKNEMEGEIARDAILGALFKGSALVMHPANDQ